MSDERRLLAAGMPLEDAISICNDLRRECTLLELLGSARKDESNRTHKCNCAERCERCTCR